MNKIEKINFKISNYDKEQGNSRLVFVISGQNINYIVVNTLRRTILSEIPVLAFNDFKFEKNTTLFHNNYLKLRLQQMPVWGVENMVDFIEISKKQPTTDIIEEDNDADNEAADMEILVDDTLNVAKYKQLTLYANYKNKTTNIVTLTTNDVKFYYDEKQILSPYKVGIPLIKLHPKEEIIFSAITKIGIEQENAMYSAVCIAPYKEISPTEFEFTIDSRGQLDELRIVIVAILNIERKIKSFIKLLQEDTKNNYDESLEGIIIVNNHDHTLGNLISRGLQQHNKISFAGYNLPHPLAKIVHFHWKLEKKGYIKSVLVEVCDYYLELFGQIKKLIK